MISVWRTIIGHRVRGIYASDMWFYLTDVKMKVTGEWHKLR